MAKYPSEKPRAAVDTSLTRRQMGTLVSCSMNTNVQAAESATSLPGFSVFDSSLTMRVLHGVRIDTYRFVREQVCERK